MSAFEHQAAHLRLMFAYVQQEYRISDCQAQQSRFGHAQVATLTRSTKRCFEDVLPLLASEQSAASVS